MKVLVVGGETVPGRELIRQAQERGIDVVAPGSGPFESGESLAIARAVTRAAPDQVINLATFRADSQLAVQQAEDHRQECELRHLALPAALAQVCDHLHVPLVQLSSAAVFSGTKKLAYSEQDSPDPAGVYGRTQLAGEQAISATAPRHVILRAGWLFGAGCDELLRQWLTTVRDEDGVLQARRCRFNPTPVDDLARVLLAVMLQVDCDARVWGTYHYGAVESRSESEFIREFIRVAAHHDESIYALLDHLSVTARTPEPPLAANTTLTGKKIFDTFGIKQRSWHGALQNLVKSYFPEVADA